YYITFSAIDEDTGCIATYQAALAVRYPVSILGFLRDVDANKFLSILSIKGAEEEANYNLNFRASILAEHQLNAESSRCNSVSSASHDIHAGVVEEMKYNLIDGAPSSPNNLILVE
ncbi:uncharacterized protein LOC110717189, partial [Chenopodium quinoa]|uniref:uncharacterized protein LOC110717189 n=1 Tax=Chenopodium quinoa TaxID=63459 RepID=UPI000B76B903